MDRISAETDDLIDSMEEDFTNGIITRYLDIEGVRHILESISQRGCITRDSKMLVVSSFALGVTLARKITVLDRLMKEEEVAVTKRTIEREA